MQVRVLVVDDDKEKIGRIVQLLADAGVNRANIEVAQTGADARRRLTSARYDLLILDIALPMRAEDKPDRRGGISLLEEIVERDIYKKPLSVVGLTGFEDLHEEFAGHFRTRLWTLDYCDRSESGWMDRLKAKARYILARAEQKDLVSYSTDLCVIAALHSPELKALRAIDWHWSSAQSFDEVGFYYEGRFESGGQSRSVVAAAAPRMGMVAAALLSLKMILKFRPRILTMVGICAGVKGNCVIGDVLIADPSWDWQMGKFVNGVLYIAPDQIDVPTAVGARFVQLAEDQQLWFDIHRSFEGAKPSNLPTVKVGPVPSGSAVLADLHSLSEIKLQHRQLLGVEMELYGMYAAARDSSFPAPTTFGMKSVCDFGDKQKTDEYQSYAAYVSASALAAFCQRFGMDFFNRQV
jgi:nucleoside phosphorylase